MRGKYEEIKSKTLTSPKKHYALSVFVIYTLSLLSLYNLTVEFVSYLNTRIHTSIATMTTLLLVGIAAFFMTKQTDYPIEFFGVNLNNYKKNIIEAVIWSIYFCIGLTILKYLLVTFLEPYKSIPNVLEIQKNANVAGFIHGLLYFIFSAVQAFIVQGAIQSSLMKLLTTSKAIIISVIVSTLIFGAIHIDLNIIYAIFVMIPGFMWAIMYAKQKSLLGVTLSHGLIGLWAFFALDYTHIFAIINKLLLG